jgi:hypothetical protein
MLIDSICTQETQLLFDIKIQHSEGLGFLLTTLLMCVTVYILLTSETINPIKLTRYGIVCFSLHFTVGFCIIYTL